MRRAAKRKKRNQKHRTRDKWRKAAEYSRQSVEVLDQVLVDMKRLCEA